MKRSFTDQMNRTVEIDIPPRRILSIVPSQTELLYDLGLEEEVAGITKFCIHPQEWFRNKKRVGGTKKLNIDTIARISPDLIIGNKEENTEEEIKELEKIYPVWMSDVHTLEDALQMIGMISEMTGKEKEGQAVLTGIREAFAKLPEAGEKITVAYFIWQKPHMVAGGDTFINEMLDKAGFRNICNDQKRYPEIALEEMKRTQPEYIFLSSEPYPFKEKHLGLFQDIYPRSRIVLVDGEMFSWYGSRLLKAPTYFLELRKMLGLDDQDM